MFQSARLLPWRTVYENIRLVREDAEKKIYGKFSDMNEREKIIEPKDKIIIGFSGGKDSLLLTNLLGQLMKDKRYQI